MTTEFILKVIPMATALVAIIISPLISIYVTKKQLRASVNSKSRQEWINTLRDEITTYLYGFVKLDGMQFDNHQALENNQNIPHTIALTKQLDELKKSIIKITLLINPNETDHKKLVTKLEEAYKNLASSSKIEKENLIIELSQTILKREWERVKSLE